MIAKLKFKSHPIMGDLCLDFCKEDGKPYNNVVIIGENGCGKTTVLKTIANYFAGGDTSHSEMTYVCRNGEQMSAPFFSVGFCYSGLQTEYLKGNEFFGPRERSEVDIDQKTYEEDTSEKVIKDLLLNIVRKDNDDLAKMVHSESSMAPDDYISFEQRSRLNRFKSAFNDFFEDVRLKEVDYEAGKVIFQKNGHQFEMVNLSTGEKQIVVRGALILKNLKKMQDGVVLIDEPETGMHPRWAKRIMKYFQRLVTFNEQQCSQIIFSSHSELVLESALKDKNNTLIILLKNEGDKVEARRVKGPFVLPSITSSEVNYEAFHIVSNDYHNQLYAYLQELLEAKTVKETDKKIFQSPSFDKERHYKESSYKTCNYCTLPTYIRNAIDHPNNGNKYEELDLQESIELLRRIIVEHV